MQISKNSAQGITNIMLYARFYNLCAAAQFTPRSGNSCGDAAIHATQLQFMREAQFASGGAGHIARREVPYIACRTATYIAREAHIARA